jgi:MATE family multidrug resistance protein
MEQTHSIPQKIHTLVLILVPILITQLAIYAMNFFDTVMSGHASAEDLAGVAIGSSIWLPINTGLSGILLAVTPIVAQLAGANRKDEIPFTVMQGVYLALVISAAVIISGALALKPVLNAMALEDNVREVAYQYLAALAFGIVPLFIYTVLRCLIDALGHTRVTMMMTLVSLPVNVVFNYLFIFGKMGFPKLGGVGAGVASAITYWIILMIAIIVTQRRSAFKNYLIFGRWYHVSWAAWKEQLKIGLPIGFSIFFETSIFAAVTLLMSRFNTATIAAHQAAFNFEALLYMMPLSISLTLTILVGFEVGAKRFRDARTYTCIGMTVSVGLACVCALLLFFLNEQIAKMYTTDTAVISLTKQFLLYAIFFQLSDAIAAPIQGALRGYKDVNISLLTALIAYWLIGLPAGHLLAVFSPLGAYGYWVGLVIGLAIGAAGLLLRLLWLQRRPEAHV